MLYEDDEYWLRDVPDLGGWVMLGYEWYELERDNEGAIVGEHFIPRGRESLATRIVRPLQITGVHQLPPIHLNSASERRALSNWYSRRAKVD